MRRGLVRLAAGILVGTVVSAIRLPAQDGVWSVAGPAGGTAYCLAEDPTSDVLYAGTDDGVLAGRRDGESWSRANAGIDGLRVQSIAIDPVHPKTLYAGVVTADGVPSAGIFKSEDAGGHWAAIDDGLVDPTTGVSPLDVSAIAVDPTNASVLVIGTRFSEIFRSIDGGATWTPQTSSGFVQGLVTDGAALRPVRREPRVCRHQPGVRREHGWRSQLGIRGRRPRRLHGSRRGSVDAGHPVRGEPGGRGRLQEHGFRQPLDRLERGALGRPARFPRSTRWPWTRTTRGSWSSAPRATASSSASTGRGRGRPPDPEWSGPWSTPSRSPASPPRRSWGRIGDGVFRSADLGSTWSASSAGFDASLVSSLVADPQTPGRAVAGAYDGIHLTSDGALDWTAAAKGLAAPGLRARVRRRKDASRGNDRRRGLREHGRRSELDRRAPAGSTDPDIGAVAVDPSDSRTVYAGTAHPYDGTNSERVFKSTDGGATWTQTSLDAQDATIFGITVDPSKPAQVAAVSPGDHRVFSDDRRRGELVHDHAEPDVRVGQRRLLRRPRRSRPRRSRRRDLPQHRRRQQLDGDLRGARRVRR